MKHLIKILSLLVLMFISQQVLALRCGNKLVGIGDHKPKVISICGEPDFTEFREIRFPSHCVDRGLYDDESYYYHRKYEYEYNNNYHRRIANYASCQYLTVEVWIYNFGPRKFMRELVFRRGVVKEINTLSYGY